MARKNKRFEEDYSLPLIKEEKRPMPKCPRFPDKTTFTSGYRAQVAIDDIKSYSNRDKVPTRVYECKISDGGCGYFHTTSQDEFREYTL